MASSRRDFLKKGSLVALVAVVPLGLAEKIFAKEFAKEVAKEIDTPSKTLGLSQAEFQRQLNTSFVVKQGTQKIPVKLVAVNELRRKEVRSAGKECFGLRFRGSHSNFLKQNTYAIQHQELGEFSFLLVPIGVNDKSAPYYEAIINRLHA